MFQKPVSRREVLQSGAIAMGAAAFGGVASVELVQPRGASAQDDERGILIMRGGSAQFPPTFNPLLNDVRVWLYDGLVRFDPDVKPIPDLAESWEISDDGLVYTFHLRQDVKFHDGTPMTAADVVFTAEKTLDESVNSPYRAKFVINGTPVQWAQVDDYTVTATLPQPSGSFLSKTSRADEIFFAILPKHLLDGVEDMTTASFNQNPVGTGPFKFNSYDTDQQLVMDANDDYYQGKPGVKQVVRLNFPSEQSALAALQAGDLDVASLREAGNVKAAEGTDGVTVERYDSNWIFAGRYNMTNSVLSDKAVREAISYAVDRENLVKAVVSPTASVGNSPISIGWAASPDVTVFAYDPEKAKSVLEEAGWTGDGVREKDGQKASITVTLYPDYAAPDLAAGMQQLLLQVGIEMNINQLEYAAFETEVYQNQNFDMYLDWQGFGVDPDIASRWVTNDAETGSYLDNPSNYSNPDVDVALTAASTALTQEDRQKNLWDAQNLITADAPAIWLQLWEAQIALDSAIAGYETPGTTADMDNTGIFREPWKITSTRS